jgi:hypothetical protein
MKQTVLMSCIRGVCQHIWKRESPARLLMVAVVLHLGSGRAAEAAAARPAPPLPAPTGTVVTVSTESQLQAAVSALKSNTTIVIAAGTYTLTGTLYVNGTFTNVGLRGATGNADDVVLAGPGMTSCNQGAGVGACALPFGIWVGGNVQGITIANLTVRDLPFSPINLNAGTQTPHIYNVRLVNAGQQFLKSDPDGNGGGVNDGLVEYAVIEYDTTSLTSYTNGVDVHTGQNWIIRNSLFRNIQAPAGQGLAGPAILMWNGSTNSLAEGNTFINCQREIAFGLIERVTPHDQSGGVIRNNFIYRQSGLTADVGIGVFDSPDTQVLQNTLLLSGTYPNAVEYRFVETTGVLIENNLSDGAYSARDGATGTVASNSSQAMASMFVNPAAGDLHLKAAATKAPVLANAPLDWDGQTRLSSTDLGADQFGATASPPSAPTNLRITP